MTELNYNEYREKVLSQIRDTKNIVLATAADDHVTTRAVGHILLGEDIIFSTGGSSFKISQIKANPNVAFYLDGVNIEAAASVYGHPETHPEFVKAYKIKYPEYVNQYGYDPGDVAVVCQISKIQIYMFTDKACKDIIDFKKKKAYRIEL